MRQPPQSGSWRRNEMELQLKISLCDEQGQRFFGRGVYQLLRGIRETGSLRAAAMDMGMAYSKAYRIMKRAEEGFGFSLTRRKSGGIGGGGSALTPKAEELVRRYEALSADCAQISDTLFQKYFGDF